MESRPKRVRLGWRLPTPDQEALSPLSPAKTDCVLRIAGLKGITAILLAVSLVTGCSTTGPTGATPPTASTGILYASTLDQLLAPIALYPDALLAQVLASAASPEQVKHVKQWLDANSQLTGTDRQMAAETAGFDASFIALVLFPDVIDLMARNIDWTSEIGRAYLSDQKSVTESIQRLRAQAMQMGNLRSGSQQIVITETQGGQQVIVIRPANPQVVYVPQYNTQTVYSQPPPASSGISEGAAVATALISFGLGVALGAALSDNHHHYGYNGWNSWGFYWNRNAVFVGGGVWRVPPHPHYPYVAPMPVYRYKNPVATPAFSHSKVNIKINRNVNIYGDTPRPMPVYNARQPRGAAADGSGYKARPQQNQQGTKSQAAGGKREAPSPRTGSPGSAGNSGGKARTQAQQLPTERPMPGNTSSRGRADTQKAGGSSAGQPRQLQTGTSSSAFSGYGNKSSAEAASARGRTSARKNSGSKK